VILVADEVTTLDPYRMVSVHPGGSVAYHLWDTLTVLNDDLEVEPHLAKSWQLINNFTWEISLRQGVTFHNGEPLDGNAVRFSVERAQSPNSLETFAQDTALQRVEIVDDYTVRFVTSRPISNLAYHLSALEILPPTYYGESAADQLARAPVGSGPYQVVEFVPGERVVLEAMSTYWKGAPNWPNIVFQTVPDVASRLEALNDGKAALVTDLPPTKTDEWQVAGSRLEAIESTQRMLVGIHAGPDSPLASKDIRRALNFGVDVESITQEWLKGYGTRYGSWVNPPANNVQLQAWPYDPRRAAELLTEAGYPDGFATTLVAPLDAYYESAGIAQAIADHLGRVGVTIQVEMVDWDTFAERLMSATPPPLFLLAMNSRGDALQDTKNLSTNFPFNPISWQNESFEGAVERAQNSFNENARSRALDEAQAIAYDEAPWIWLWRQYRFYGVIQELDWTPRRDGLVHVYGFQAQDLAD
jgi:peptide/nickel transport system substrate-binding protein